MVSKENDFYQKLRRRMRKYLQSPQGKSSQWAEFLMFAPDLFHLLCRLMMEPEVPAKDKAKLAAVIAYFISPLDLIPEAILGPFGYIDDIALAAYALNSVINKTNPEVVKRHWAGEEDVIKVIQNILAVADKMVGSGLWKKLKRIAGM